MEPEGLVRLWVNDYDYGTMHESVARSYKAIHAIRFPDDDVRIEEESK